MGRLLQHIASLVGLRTTGHLFGICLLNQASLHPRSIDRPQISLNFAMLFYLRDLSHGICSLAFSFSLRQVLCCRRLFLGF